MDFLQILLSLCLLGHHSLFLLHHFIQLLFNSTQLNLEMSNIMAYIYRMFYRNIRQNITESIFFFYMRGVKFFESEIFVYFMINTVKVPKLTTVTTSYVAVVVKKTNIEPPRIRIP